MSDQPFVTRAEFARWRGRATAAFVVVFLAATAAAYLGYTAGRSSDSGLATNAKQAVVQSCDDRADGRITTALGFDQLRFSAVQTPKTAEQRRQIERFITATQRPINALLNQAAFGTERALNPIHTHGELVGAHGTDPELTRAREMAASRCRREAAKFDGTSALAG